MSGGLQTDPFHDEARKEQEGQNVQDSGWFEVKKKHRSSTKSGVTRSVNTEKKASEASGKQKHDGTGHCGSVVEPREFKERDGQHAAKTSLVDTGDAPQVDHEVCTVIADAPKFRWGNLEEEELTRKVQPRNNVDKHAENGLNSMATSENCTVLLEGGNQSSTKELNGIQSDKSHNMSPEYNQRAEVEITSSIAQCTPGLQRLEIITSNSSVGSRKDAREELAIDVTKILVKSLAENMAQGSPQATEGGNICGGTQEDAHSARSITENQINYPEAVTFSTDVQTESKEGLSVSLEVNRQCQCQDGTAASTDVKSHDGLQALVSTSVDQAADRERVASDLSMEFTKAASVLMEKFEESESGESKERFRQRLWCYLFENLNRAIDELYFLCELECDLQQIEEARLVLKEAGLDFSELKSRVEGFEKVKKHSSTSQVLLAGTLGGVFSGKVEHRRPHAIAWEVRRMASSPHRAEILSSSLEAFKKVQQITAQNNSAFQPKRRDAARLLEMQQSSKELPTKLLSSTAVSKTKEASSRVEEKFRTKPNFGKAPCQTAKEGSVKAVQNTGNNEPGLIENVTGPYCLRFPPSGKVSTTMEIVVMPPKVVERIPGKLAFAASKNEKGPAVAALNKVFEKRVSILDNEREKKMPKTRISLDAWKVKRNWEDVLSSPLKSSNRVARSPCPGSKSTERVKVLHDKLMSPERKRKSPLEMKKEVDEKQARATRIRGELETERAQRLQRTTEKLNRVSEWQAVRSNKLREGMHARQQRGESRHEAHLAEIARRASDESIKVSEVRFITSLNEENKKLSLRQRLQDSELRRAERLQIIKIKQKEDVAREEAVLERRRLLEVDRLQRIAETQRKKEEAIARRDEERKAASAAREARAVEQVRKKEVRAKAQQEEAELQAQKLIEKLRESELRRKVYLEQIRERAAMESREQASPSTRRPSSRDGYMRNPNQGTAENDSNIEKELIVPRQASGSKGAAGLQRQAFKKRVKKIRQRLMAKKYDIVEPPVGSEGSGIGSTSVAAAARSKIGRWLQDLHRLQQARKAGSSGVGFIVGEMIKYLGGKEAELHAARQAGFLDFVATALPASHTSKPEASQTTLSLVRILKVLLSLPANRSYFIAKNLLPPLIPMLSIALENFSSLDSASVVSTGGALSANGTTEKVLSDEKLDAVGEVLIGLLECVTLITGHSCIDDRQISMKEDLSELIVACEVIHHLRDLFSLFDRPQIEGAPFPAPVLFGLNLLQSLTIPRAQMVGLPYDVQLNMMIEKCERVNTSILVVRDSSQDSGTCSSLLDSAQPCPTLNEGVRLEEHCIKNIIADAAHAPAKEENIDGLFTKPVDPCTHVTAQTEEDSSLVPEVPTKTGDFIKIEALKTEDPIMKLADARAPMRGDGKSIEEKVDKGPMPQSSSSPHEGRSISFLVSVITETGLIGLPSLLTAVLLQTNPRSTPDQAAAALPSNFEEVATGVLKVLNNLARLDLALVQSLLARPDLQMEFFHLVSFLLSHCTCKWNNATDQVASLLLETLLLLGYFALLHPGNQAVLRWGKSPTILHKICDLPFAFFSDPMLMPILVGTLLAVCYGSEQNRDVVREELSMDMLLSLLKSSRNETIGLRDNASEDAQTSLHVTPNINQGSQMGAILEEPEEEMQTAQDKDGLYAKEEINRANGDSTGSDSEITSSSRQQSVMRPNIVKSLSGDVLVPSPNRKLTKSNAKSAIIEGETPKAKMRVTSTNCESAPRKSKGSSNATPGMDSALRATVSSTVVGPVSYKRPYITTSPVVAPLSVTTHDVSATAEPCAMQVDSSCILGTRCDFLLQNRFPTCLLDSAQHFFSVGM